MDEFGMTADDWRWLSWEQDKFMLAQRWKALKTLWGPPVIDERSTGRRTDGVTDYTANRDGNWTVWRAVCATVGVVLGRYWHAQVEARYRAKYGYARSSDMAYWDSHPVYGGYTVDCLWLYPGCRVSIFNDGETNL